MSNIGENIRFQREDKNLSLQDLALKVRCGVQTIQDYENGNRIPDTQTILKISTALDVPTSGLVEERV